MLCWGRWIGTSDPGAVYTSLFGSMPFLFRSRRRHSTGAASWLIPIRRAVTFLQRGGGGGDDREEQERGFFQVCLWSVCLSVERQTDGGIMSLRLDSSDSGETRHCRRDGKHPHHHTGNRHHTVFVFQRSPRVSADFLENTFNDRTGRRTQLDDDDEDNTFKMSCLLADQLKYLIRQQISYQFLLFSVFVFKLCVE